MQATKRSTRSLTSSRFVRAFSLVELVIVIVIIGVIAAIAVTRVGQGAEASGESALRGSLSVLRSAIDLYAAEHHGVFPGTVADGMGGAAGTATALENQLMKYSNAQGGASATSAGTHPLGPYLRRVPPVPVGPNAGKSGIAIDAANSPPLVTGGTEGWVYNPSTGEILANTDATDSTGTRTYDEY